MAATKTGTPPKTRGRKPSGSPRRRRGVKLKPTDLGATDLALTEPPAELTELAAAVRADGGAVLATYREPLGGLGIGGFIDWACGTCRLRNILISDIFAVEEEWPLFRLPAGTASGHIASFDCFSANRPLRPPLALGLADGRTMGDLAADDRLDGVRIVSAALIPYRYSHTYDILPASDTGTYYADGVLVGSTLAPAQRIAKVPVPTCRLVAGR